MKIGLKLVKYQLVFQKKAVNIIQSLYKSVEAFSKIRFRRGEMYHDTSTKVSREVKRIFV